ncbi:MAG TPA: hypothetical protein PK159_09745 [Steroidobacteraceae bacterium]|nr:hypothetical protein [Steroidobacteraceae bacterium]
MTDSSEDNWLAGLAGRASIDATPASREGRLLRQALVTQLSARTDMGTADDPPADREQRLAVLLEKARAAGLLTADTSGSAVRLPTGRRMRWRAAAAATIVALAVAITWLVTPAPESLPVRTADDGIVRLQADDPLALKQQLLQSLRAAGVVATGYESFGRHGVDAELPSPLTADVRALLRRYGLRAPPDGVLRVEIEQRPKP